MSFLCFFEIIIFFISCFYISSSRNSCLKLREIAMEQEHYSEEFFREHKELIKKVSYLEEEMKNIHHRINNLGIKL